MAAPSAQMRIIQKKIERAVFQAQKKAARELIQVIIDAIRTRTRLLKELASGKQIPANDDSTIKARERYSKRLDADTTPSTSNATATGQMLNSMKGKANGTKITIDLKSGRRKELSGAKSTLTNSEVNKYYEEKKGEWFALSDAERTEAIDYAAEIIKEEIKNVLK
jgi:type II secretory pathway pseudopilin PulG